MMKMMRGVQKNKRQYCQEGVGDNQEGEVEIKTSLF
jgi:hypothetical protein